MGHGSHGSWVKSSMGHLGHGSLWVTHSLLWARVYGPYVRVSKSAPVHEGRLYGRMYGCIFRHPCIRDRSAYRPLKTIMSIVAVKRQETKPWNRSSGVKRSILVKNRSTRSICRSTRNVPGETFTGLSVVQSLQFARFLFAGRCKDRGVQLGQVRFVHVEWDLAASADRQTWRLQPSTFSTQWSTMGQLNPTPLTRRRTRVGHEWGASERWLDDVGAWPRGYVTALDQSDFISQNSSNITTHMGRFSETRPNSTQNVCTQPNTTHGTFYPTDDRHSAILKNV